MALALALAVAPAAAQQKTPPAKKKQQLAHKKPTPEQIRRFDELAKKRQAESR